MYNTHTRTRARTHTHTHTHTHLLTEGSIIRHTNKLIQIAFNKKPNALVPV